MNQVNLPELLGTDLYHILVYLFLLFTTLTILALIYDDDPPQPPIS